jgi:catalase
MIGVVVDPDGDLGSVAELRDRLLAAGLLPLLIAPRGGDLGKGLMAQRTFGTARSVEYDAIVVAGAAPPAPDAVVARDTKAGGTAAVSSDPRVGLLVDECFRHSKAVAAVGAGRAVLEELGIGGAGVTTGDTGADVVDDLLTLVSAHRVWERFSTTA